MRANPPSDTALEIRVRSALHRAGLRFRKNRSIVAGEVRTRPDAVFVGARVAVFIDGCFWHSCPEHGAIPKANIDYWAPKLAHNADRDRRIDAALPDAGWTVLRIWEHERLQEAVDRVVQAVRP